MTVNIGIRTMRAFIRYCYKKGFIDTPIMRTLSQSKHHTRRSMGTYLMLQWTIKFSAALRFLIILAKQ